MKLYSVIRSPNELGEADIDEMLELMARHYDDVSTSCFVKDLSEKRWIIELRQRETGVLKGFSTQMLLDCDVDGTPVTALFSGDTIVDRDSWGSTALAISWGRLVMSVMEMSPDRELFWFLICKGFRTYRFLSVFFTEFGPCWNRPFPAHERRLLERLATEKFASRFDVNRGVLVADQESYRVKPEVDLHSENRSDPHVRFFLQQNPGYQQGDELCCLARLSIDNFSPAARRLMATPEFQRN